MTEPPARADATRASEIKQQLGHWVTRCHLRCRLRLVDLATMQVLGIERNRQLRDFVAVGWNGRTGVLVGVDLR